PGKEARAAVAARIDERLRRALRIAHYDQRHADDVDGEVVAGLLQVVGAAEEVPLPHENALDFLPVELFGAVAPRRQVARLFQRPAHRCESRCIYRHRPASLTVLPAEMRRVHHSATAGAMRFSASSVFAWPTRI